MEAPDSFQQMKHWIEKQSGDKWEDMDDDSRMSWLTHVFKTFDM